MTALGVQLEEECEAVARYLLGRGVTLSPTLVAKIASADGVADDAVPELVRIHGELAALAAPATPHAILLREKEPQPKGPLSALGSVRLVRRLVVATGVFLLAFVGAAMSPDVTHDASASDLLSNSGTSLLVNVIFLAAAAGLGAAFAALFRANTYLSAGTYDPTYEYSYWMLLVLGVIAGLILSEVVTEVGEGQASVARPLLALLGGFSASAVHRILTRLVETVEELFRGSPRDLVEQANIAARARTAMVVGDLRIELAGKLLKLQQALNTGAAAEVLEQHLNEALERVLPEQGLSSSVTSDDRASGSRSDGNQDAQEGQVAVASLSSVPPASAEAGS